jgi:radical SAM/Cys-rich protein
MVSSEGSAQFENVLAAHGIEPLRRRKATTLQVNMGKRCNMACRHCHVDAGPLRDEMMSAAIVDRVIELVEKNPEIIVVDITGGAPELHPSFGYLVERVSRLHRSVIDRCNLTVLLEPGMEGMTALLARHRVRVVASLPCYGPENVDKQRGSRAFVRSIEALRMLNACGYARTGSGLVLDLVYNPVGSSLPPAQATLEAEYRAVLRRDFHVEFDQLLTITNMPIKRFAEQLAKENRAQAYAELLVQNFNPVTADAVMCRSLVSVGWNGRLHDCDFNQMLELGLGQRPSATVWDIDDLRALSGERIATDTHCFGCTAGAGSSCSGALA